MRKIPLEYTRYSTLQLKAFSMDFSFVFYQVISQRIKKIRFIFVFVLMKNEHAIYLKSMNTKNAGNERMINFFQWSSLN